MWQKALTRLRQDQQQLDMQVNAWRRDYDARGGHIHCRRGCRNCCNLAVHATFTEALAISRALNDDKIEAVHRHVSRLLNLQEQMTDLKSYLRLHRQQVGFSPLLEDDGACTIYPHRPFSCRALISTRNAAWCDVDFAELHPLEKQAFLSSLDPHIVAFPSHYVAATQELGRECEDRTANAMLRHFGVVVTGNLPFLIWLENEYSLSSVIPQGATAVIDVLTPKGLFHPMLIRVET
jgi:Fe-S-cluster containining protein